MNRAEPPHRYLLEDVQILEIDLQNRIQFQTERALAIFFFAHAHLLKLLFQLFNFLLLFFKLPLQLHHLAEPFTTCHLWLFVIEPRRSLHTSLFTLLYPSYF